jgi:hypothetical protein
MIQAANPEKALHRPTGKHRPPAKAGTAEDLGTPRLS